MDFGHKSSFLAMLTWGDFKKYPFIQLEFQFANFGRILVMKMHQKLSHFGQLNDCFSIPEVWLRPDTVATTWHIIKTTVVDFKSHIKSLIGQIWLTEISWNRYFEVFSVPYCIPVGFWALATNFQMWKRPWNREIAFSRSLEHLDGSLKIALPKTEDFPKKWFLNKNDLMFWARKLLNISIFTRATHLSHPQTLTGKKWNFSFFSEIPLFWIGSSMTAQNDLKWPLKIPEMVLIC